MSELGQSLPKWALDATSAYPPTAAVQQTFPHFGFVPTRDPCELFDRLVGAGEQRPQLAGREFLRSD
jgi:hypothetical protein